MVIILTVFMLSVSEFSNGLLFQFLNQSVTVAKGVYHFQTDYPIAFNTVFNLSQCRLPEFAYHYSSVVSDNITIYTIFTSDRADTFTVTLSFRAIGI